MYSQVTYLQVAMKATLRQIGTWILMHPRLVSALAFTALVVVAFIVMPELGVARRKWKP